MWGLSTVGLERSSLRTFEEFYRAEFPSIYRSCYVATGDREVALDATQEAFKRAFVRWRRLSNETWAGGWVMTTALNACRRRRREAMTQSDLGEGRKSVGDPGPERADVVAALARLPFRQRQAIVLYYIGDLPLEVVAHLMGVSEGTVKAHLAQARAALRTSLEVRHA